MAATPYEKTMGRALRLLSFKPRTIAEMRGEMDVYEAIDRYSRQGNIAYVHFRNVRGKVPNYVETFIDDGGASPCATTLCGLGGRNSVVR